MLVLTRGQFENVNIDGPDGLPLGVVTVVEIRGNTIRLGFDFPTDYRIMRSELVDDTLPPVEKTVQ